MRTCRTQRGRGWHRGRKTHLKASWQAGLPTAKVFQHNDGGAVGGGGGGDLTTPPFFLKKHSEFFNTNVSLELHSSSKQTQTAAGLKVARTSPCPGVALATTVPELAKVGVSSPHPPTFSVFGALGKWLWDSASTHISSKTQRLR